MINSWHVEAVSCVNPQVFRLVAVRNMGNPKAYGLAFIRFDRGADPCEGKVYIDSNSGDPLPVDQLTAQDERVVSHNLMADTTDWLLPRATAVSPLADLAAAFAQTCMTADSGVNHYYKTHGQDFKKWQRTCK